VALSTTALLGGLGGLSAAEVPAVSPQPRRKPRSPSPPPAAATPAAALAAKGCHAMKLVAVVKSALIAATVTATIGIGGALAVAAESGGKPKSQSQRAPGVSGLHAVSGTRGGLARRWHREISGRDSANRVEPRAQRRGL